MKFSEYPYSRPDPQAIVGEYKSLAAQVAQAQESQTILALWQRHQELSGEYSRMATVASIRYSINTQDPFWKGENDFYDAQSPAVSAATLEFYRAILASPHGAVLGETYGQILLQKLEIEVKSADDRVVELMAQENALCSQYQTLYASAMVEFEGKELTLPQLAPYKMSPVRATRRQAYEAEGRWFDQHQEELDQLYTQLIQNRNQQAQILGYEDYSQLSYLRMGRIGYDMNSVAEYRRQIAGDVVPLVAQLVALRRQRLGLTDAKYYDASISFPQGNPQPQGTPQELLDHCRTLYHELSPETAEFVDWMFENETFDVLSKPGKSQGGYMTDIEGYGPFVFANWNGTFDDVDTITHEMGHAFQGYVAQHTQLPQELRSPTMESCEIHSMSMEFLTSPWHHLFFGDQTDRYQLMHAEDSVFFLPYGCMVDEFQHIAYQNPSLTPAERNAVWMELERKYRPWNDFDGLPFYGRGAGWQRQLHIYLYPFYYIDYCLAQTVALQFFAAHLKDPKDAWKRYLALVNQCGAASYQGLVKAAGMEVPFQEGVMARVMEPVVQWIRSHQPQEEEKE